MWAKVACLLNILFISTFYIQVAYFEHYSFVTGSFVCLISLFTIVYIISFENQYLLSFLHYRFRVYLLPFNNAATKRIIDGAPHGDIYTPATPSDHQQMVEGILKFIETAINKIKRPGIQKKPRVCAQALLCYYYYFVFAFHWFLFYFDFFIINICMFRYVRCMTLHVIDVTEYFEQHTFGPATT